MINENQDFEQRTQENTEANIPLSEARSAGIDKLKSYGQKSLTPLIGLLQKYQSAVTPYFEAIGKGLDAGVKSLDQENSSHAEKYVGEWFREASQWFGQIKSKLNSKDTSELLLFIEDQVRKYPAMMFSSSYFVGLFLGRIGRHVGRTSQSSIQ